MPLAAFHASLLNFFGSPSKHAASAKNSFASASTFSAGSASDSRVKLRSSAISTAEGLRSVARATGVSGGGDAVQVMLPDVEVALAGGDGGVFHAKLSSEFLHRAPAGVRMLDVGFGVQLKELELRFGQIE